jgi:hypothetical protein
MNSMMSTVRRKGRFVADHFDLGPRPARAKSVRVDRSFCWALGSPRASRILAASSVVGTRLNVTEQRSLYQVRGNFFVDSQLFEDDEFDRTAIKGCKASDSASDAGGRAKRWKFHASDFGCVDLGIATDGSEVTIKQCGVKQGCEAVGFIDRQLSICMVDIIEMVESGQILKAVGCFPWIKGHSVWNGFTLKTEKRGAVFLPFGSASRNSVARNITTGPVEMRSPCSQNRWGHDSTALAIPKSSTLVGILMLACPQLSSMTFAAGRIAVSAA